MFQHFGFNQTGMALDSLTLRDGNLEYLLQKIVEGKRHVRKQSIGEPEEGLRVHYNLFEKMMIANSTPQSGWSPAPSDTLPESLRRFFCLHRHLSI